MALLKPILLVEDDLVDASTAQQALEDLRVRNPVIHKTDGEDALEYLQNPDNPIPAIILLDLNMPKISGIDLLEVLKKDPQLQHIPIVVLTVSKYEQDKLDTFDLGIAGYVIKAVDYDEFLRTMDIIVRYWIWNGLLEKERETQNAEL
ncbi:MAG: response regulator [Sedimentisphaerales bacterium]|nr:response regulator [Sedimentisphaerales bacterium]